MQLEIQKGRDPSGDPERLSEGSGTLCGHHLECVRTVGGDGGNKMCGGNRQERQTGGE